MACRLPFILLKNTVFRNAQTRRKFFAYSPCKIRRVDLNRQSVLLPGQERIRSSAYLEDPNQLLNEIPGSPEIRNIYQVLYHGMKVSGDGPCIGSKNPSTGEYEWLRYSEVIAKTQAIGSGLIEFGVDSSVTSLVGIFAANRKEFLLSMYACAGYSMVSVPLYLSLSIQSIIFIINQAELSVIVVNSEQNGLRILELKEKIPSLKKLVTVDKEISQQFLEASHKNHVQITTLQQLEDIGKSHPKELKLAKLNDLFCIPYTSGTTGVPKGVMLSHQNVVACTAALVVGYGKALRYGETIISYLPPAHIYEICNEIMSLYFARQIAFYSGDIKRLMDEVQIIKPSVLPLVPRLMTAIYSKTLDSVKDSFLKSTCLKLAVWWKDKLLKKGVVTRSSLADSLILKPFQKALGGKVFGIITASAAVSNDVMNFFRRASGAYVFEKYGQTEMLAATMTLPHETEGGSVGPPLPCNYVKLVDVPDMNYFSKDDVGEVCVKGKNVFMGYYKNEEANKESLVDGWQHTGDIGKWLPNGTLKIIDRKKHIFKLSQGEYIAPEKIENAYNYSELVQQIFIDGFPDQNYIVAVVCPEIPAVKKWLKTKGYRETDDIVSVLKSKDIKRSFLEELHKIGEKEDLNRLEQARNMEFVEETFPLELLTPTLKMKRNFARKHFHQTIQKLYEEGPLL